jgi:hypothetical protein
MIHSFLLHPADQPLFSVDIRSAGCDTELWVNDVPVFRDSSGASTHLTIPINEWLFQGVNDIRLTCAGLSAGAGNVTAILEHRRLRQSRKNTIPVITLGSEGVRSSPPEDGETSEPWEPEFKPDAISALPGETMDFYVKRRPSRWAGRKLVLGARFLLPGPWPLCPWADASALNEQPNLIYSVMQLTSAVWELLHRRDQSALMRLAAFRGAALESAYHLDAREIEDALFFPKLLQSPDWRAAPFPQEELLLEVAGEGRLARVVDPGTGESPLRLINEAADLEATIDAWWAFTNKWVLMR